MPLYLALLLALIPAVASAVAILRVLPRWRAEKERERIAGAIWLSQWELQRVTRAAALRLLAEAMRPQ